jgi:hypothetical protein
MESKDILFGVFVVGILLVGLVGSFIIVYRPIQLIRRMRTPACTGCKWLKRNMFLPNEGLCKCPTYIEHTNRRKATTHIYADIRLVRGSRHCNYEEQNNDNR